VDSTSDVLLQIDFQFMKIVAIYLRFLSFILLIFKLH